MDIKDQVAIHEAMEQQTISIAKAGIHATLNARTSILAAANPIGGRYDKTKSLRQNVALSPPIMSRFDLFFVILDEPDEQRDYQLAKYILNAHRNPEQTIKPPYTTDMLRRFILFTRALKPRLTKSAMEVLVRKYQSLRQADSIGKNGYRITVRQLESLIRLSEAIARAHAESEVKARHVQAASILLQKSIIQRESGEINLDEGDDFTKQVLEQEEAENGMDTENAPNTATNNEDSVPGLDNVVKKQISMTEEEYMRLVRSVIGLLEEKERQRRTERAMAQVTNAEDQQTENMETGDEEADAQAEEKNDDVQIGLTFAEIREWYLNKIESSVHCLDDYAYQYRLVQKVLKRMIKVVSFLFPGIVIIV
jgi:DNA replication licensing factor MCM6